MKADTAERKVTRWQASGICSSCTTGMSSVMAQPPCFEHRALPPPHLGWPCHLWGHVQEDKGRGFLLPHPAPASTSVGSKQRDGIGGPPLPLPPPGTLERQPLAQPGPQLLHLQMGMIHVACPCHRHVGGVVNSTRQRGFKGWVLCHGSKSPMHPCLVFPWTALCES